MRRRDLLILSSLVAAPAFAQSRNRRFDLSTYELSFSTEFDNPRRPLMRVDGGPFSTRFEEWGGLRTLPGNKEAELYVDPSFVPAHTGTDELGRADALAGSRIKPLGINPFSLSHGALDITAIPAPHAQQELVDRQYLSGMISTDRTFAQRYGYFEMRAALPGGRGLWPAFWLVSKTQQEHIEIDVMEAIGGDTAHVYQSTHLKPSRGKGIHVRVGGEHFDYTTVHTYGLEWTPDELIFYIDGSETARTEGGPFRDAPPMYMIANLAVGGEWAGNPDSNTHFPAVMRIEHIRAYRPK